MIVKDIMSSSVVSVNTNQSVTEAAKLMSNYNIGSVPVVAENSVLGIITDRDIVLRCIAKEISANDCKVGDIMSTGATYVTSDQPVYDAIKLMASHQVRRLPVIDNGKLLGIVSLADIARERCTPEIAEALSEISLP